MLWNCPTSVGKKKDCPFPGSRRTEPFFRDSRGSFTLEAAVSVLVFVFAFCALVFLVDLERTQNRIQLALDKTALELSGTCYTAGAVCDGISEAVSSARKGAGDGKMSALLSGGDGLLSMARGTADSASVGDILGSVFDDVKGKVENGNTLGDSLATAYQAFGDTPAKAALSVATLLLEPTAADTLSHVVAIPLCRWILPRYLCEGDADVYLKTHGIREGMDGIDFSLSEVMPDGRGILLCAAYEIRFSSVLPLSFRTVQVASTGSWCDAGEKKTETSSVWTLGNFQRGKRITEYVKKQNPSFAVKPGYGFDLYSEDPQLKRIVSVVSLNPFCATYSVYSGGESQGTPDDYELKPDKIEKLFREKGKELKEAVSKLGNGKVISTEKGRDVLASGDGAVLALKVVLPEEAKRFETELKRIGTSAKAKNGVEVSFLWKDKAFLNDNTD